MKAAGLLRPPGPRAVKTRDGVPDDIGRSRGACIYAPQQLPRAAVFRVDAQMND